MADFLMIMAEGAAEPASFGILTATTWVSIAMAIFIAILLWKKVPALVAGMLDNKIAEISKQLKEAEQLRLDAESLKAEYEAKLADAAKEADEMRARADAEAEALVTKAKADATEPSPKMMRNDAPNSKSATTVASPRRAPNSRTERWRAWIGPTSPMTTPAWTYASGANSRVAPIVDESVVASDALPNTPAAVRASNSCTTARGIPARSVAPSNRQKIVRERWTAFAHRCHFEELNELIGQHNEWYPIERDLPMDLRTRDYVLINGRSYRREPLSADWVLRHFPA